MNFDRVPQKVFWHLVTEGSISYRRIKPNFGLDHDGLEELRRELIGIKRVAADVDGEVLVWAPERRAARPEPAALLQPLSRAASVSEPVHGAIRRYDGFVAKHMGDGVLAYFGCPRAHEDEAERSVRAGLDIVEVMAELNAAVPRLPGVGLAVRIGIATGPAIVGDQIGEGTASETAVVGETPNLAARLRALAQPNQIVVGAATGAMLGGRRRWARRAGVAPKPTVKRGTGYGMRLRHRALWGDLSRRPMRRLAR